MSKLRPETTASREKAIPYDTALYLIKESVERRSDLIYGKLHDKLGGHCAIGCFWTDNPKAVLSTDLIDEVAAVNDSVPFTASSKERWKVVSGWLRWKIRGMSGNRIGRPPKIAAKDSRNEDSIDI